MNSFTTRLTLRFAALVTATTAVVLAAGGWLLDRQLVSGLELLHDVEGVELIELIGPDPSLTEAELKNRIEHDADSDAALFFIQVHNEQGTVLFRSENLGATILPDRAEGSERWTAELPQIGDVRISEFRSAPWHIQIGSRLAPNRRVLREYARVSGLLVLGVAVAGVALGYGFSRYTLKPVRAIEATARRIGGDNLGERVPVPPGSDELASLTRLLNQMFDRLQVSFEQVRRFTADASHELKTPLALIRLNAEKLRPRLAGDAEAEAALGDLMEEATRLQQIIDSLLFLSKAESGVMAMERKAYDPANLVSELAQDAQVLAEDRQLRFVLARNDSGELRGEPNLIRQLLLNLVVNAMNVSARDGVVSLESSREGDHWRLVVSDEGPGLPPEQLERIFERFVRYNHAKGERPGHGLGLAICKGIVGLHAGTIAAENRTDRTGLRVVVTLPIG
ncbi:MAG TPA: ATP-binding protein [Opitutaceae bacterium]